jgi:HEAT repeat protein
MYLAVLTIVVLSAMWLLAGGMDYLRTERLVAQLGSPTVKGVRGEPAESPDQKAAFEALVAIGVKAVPSLQRGLRAENEWQRGLSAKALGRIRDRAAAPDLKRVMREDADGGVRWEAANSLRQLLGPMAAPDLILLLSDPQPSTRANAAGALGDLRAHSAIRPLVGRLGDTGSWHHSGSSVSEYAREALVRIGYATKPELIRAAASPDSLVRRRVAEVLGRLGDPSSLPQLRELSRDRDPDVRRVALEAIARIGTVPKKELPGKLAKPTR